MDTTATVEFIQIGGRYIIRSLRDMCNLYTQLDQKGALDRDKIHFCIRLPDGSHKHITVRQQDNGVIAYGDFDGLPSLMSAEGE